MGLSGFIGVLLGFLAIFAGIATSGKLSDYWEWSSVLITIGGTICATIASYSFKQFIAIGKMIRIAWSKYEIDYKESIETLLNLSVIQRREGTLALEEAAYKLNDTFLKKGIMMVVDGSDSEMVKNTMETEMNAIEERHTRGQEVFLSMSSYSPAFGMVGTLIGLINMLRNLNNIDSLGLNMAVALITTFYGVIMANLVLTPLAKRLKERTELEMRHKAMILEGVLAIQAGLNPRVIEQKLKAFLSETEIAEMERENQATEEHRIPVREAAERSA
jgi:chemotaxis protein MotA